MSEVIKVAETNIKPVPPSSKIEAQVVENQLENKPIQEVNTQLENINVSQISESVGCESTSWQIEGINTEDAPENTQDKVEAILSPVVTTEELTVKQEMPAPVQEIEAVQPEKDKIAQLPEMAITDEIRSVQQIQEPDKSTGQKETSPLKVEITTTIVIMKPSASSAKKTKVETVLQRTKVPSSAKFKTWPSRSFALPMGQPSTVYHNDGTTVITATGYHEAPGFKSEDIDKLRNAPEDEIKKLVDDSFRCQLGFIKAYFGNLREHPELPW